MKLYFAKELPKEEGGAALFLCKSEENAPTHTVMGLISSEAEWIKEGDRFNEDQIHKGTFMISHLGKSITVDHEGDSEWSNYKENNKWKKCYLIKGPCGHFH